MNNKQAGAFGGARQNIKEVYVMLLPSIFGERLFDDFMDFPFRGKMENQMMKTDIKDAGDHFELMMDCLLYTSRRRITMPLIAMFFCRDWTVGIRWYSSTIPIIRRGRSSP